MIEVELKGGLTCDPSYKSANSKRRKPSQSSAQRTKKGRSR